jgi:peptidoglycan-associated lipoprotein
MRHWTRILTIVSAVSIVGACGKPKPPAPPPPPPPVAPATPPPAPPPTTQPAPQVDEYARLKAMSADEIDRMGLLADIHFDYDKSDLREGDRSILNKNAEVLKKFDFIRVTVEGHCDERGSVEYNLALGERRAKAAYDYLVSLGVAADRLKTVSYGKFTVTGKAR